MADANPDQPAKKIAADQPPSQHPVADRGHDGGEGVITARGGAKQGEAARQNAEAAAESGTPPRSGDGASDGGPA